MLQERFRVEALGPKHDRTDFASEVDALDRYFQRQAGQDARRKVAAVFVLVDAEGDLVAGYYTLSAASIQLIQLPLAIATRLPHYRSLPAILLGRLALDSRYQGQGLGERLLADALRRALLSTEQVAAMAVIVDAKDDTAQHPYERHGFRSFVDDPRRLFLPTLTIASRPP